MNYLDTETYCATPIQHGIYRYTAECECMVVTYALGDAAPVQCWDRTLGTPMPGDLAFVLDDPDEPLTAHNAMFDRGVLRESLGIDVPIERWRCSMTKAMTHGLPGGLDKLGALFHLTELEAKHKSGRRLINLFCKPRKDKERATRETHPAEWQQFLDYAQADVRAMRHLDHKLPSWNYCNRELALWWLDQKINDRGIAVDVEFAVRAIAAVAREQKRLAQATQKLTHGAVETATLRDQLLAFILAEYGVELPDMQMATLERRVADTDLPIELRSLLAIRLQAAGTSTSKYTALVRGVQSDGRLRGTLQFSGAQRTRRWAGRTFQPHNLPRPDMAPVDIAHAIEAIKLGCEEELFNDVSRITRNAIRGCIVAPPGRKLVIADLSNIEGRKAAWFAGEQWKLQAFLDYDAGRGPDLYRLAYAKSFSVPHTSVTPLQRQIGKVQELMLQYQGGVGAFATGSAAYGIDLEALAVTAWNTIPIDVMEETVSFVEWWDKNKNPKTHSMSREARIVCDALKRMWRRAHPAIESLWADIEDAVRNAINYPGHTFDCRMFKMRRDGAWLRIMLPSGQCLCYPNPQLDARGRITYMGLNIYTKQWARIASYGGKFFENACQASAGDVLKAAMPEMEARGYQIVLTVHDEAVTETPDSASYTVAELCSILTASQPWTIGLPLAAKGFETYRFRKDD